METFPTEVWEMIIEYAMFDTSIVVRDLRAVCKDWEKIIDGFESKTKLWIRGCKTIPHNYLTDILKAKFPYAVWPWQKDYWKKSESPLIPREVFRTWKLSHANFLQSTNKPESRGGRPMDYCNSSVIKDIAVFDKYLGVLYSENSDDGNKCKVRIYDLDKYIILRKFDWRCQKINFYYWQGRLFIILFMTVTRYFACEFLKHSFSMTIISTFPANSQCQIIDNECFVISGNVITHHVFTGHKFIPSTKFSLPPDDSIAIDKNAMKIQDSDFHLAFADTENRKHIWFYRYTITRKCDGKLQFDPHKTKFRSKIDVNDKDNLELATAKSYNQLLLEMRISNRYSNKLFEKLDVNNKPYLTNSAELKEWLKKLSSKKEAASEIFATIHANYLFLCTSNGEIYIFPWTDREKFMQYVKGNAPLPDEYVRIYDPSIKYACISPVMYPTYINYKMTLFFRYISGIICI